MPAPPDNPAESYAAAPARGPYHPISSCMRGYRLTSGYVALFPATRHPLDSEVGAAIGGNAMGVHAGRRETSGGRRGAAAATPRRTGTWRRQGARSSPSIDRDILSRIPTRRAGAFSRLPNDSTMAGRRRSTAPRCRWCGWRVIFSAACWTSGVHRVEIRFMPRSFVYGSIVSAIGAVLLAGVLIARLR